MSRRRLDRNPFRRSPEEEPHVPDLSRRGFLGAARQRVAAVRDRRQGHRPGERARHRPRRRLRGEAREAGERQAGLDRPGGRAPAAARRRQARVLDRRAVAALGHRADRPGRVDAHEACAARARSARSSTSATRPASASRSAPAGMPGPTLEGEVGDTIVVHFRNADEKLNQAVTMHPHGVQLLAPVRRLLPRPVHARRRLRRARARSSPTRGSARRTRSASGPTTTTGRTTRSTPARPVRRGHRPREGRAEARTSRSCSSCTRSRRT